jgi:hypothetical protein
MSKVSKRMNLGCQLGGYERVANQSFYNEWFRNEYIPVYLLIALNVPKWCIKAIDKIRRSFLWKGSREARGGSCLIAWDKIVRPFELGGLGVPGLLTMSWALQLRWLWL